MSFRTADFYNGIYKLVVPNNQVINFDPEELAAVYWYDVERLGIEMNSSPEKFTPDFIEAWDMLGTKIISS
jgi:hypothetical protein